MRSAAGFVVGSFGFVRVLNVRYYVRFGRDVCVC